MTAVAPLADVARKLDHTRMRTSDDHETIEELRERHREALEQLRQAREGGNKELARAWETAFKRISRLRYEAGDDMNASIF